MLSFRSEAVFMANAKKSKEKGEADARGNGEVGAGAGAAVEPSGDGEPVDRRRDRRRRRRLGGAEADGSGGRSAGEGSALGSPQAGGEKERKRAREEAERLGESLCESLTRKGAKEPEWDSCEFGPGGELKARKSFTAKESRFSSGERAGLFGEATLNMMAYLQSRGAMHYGDTGFWLGVAPGDGDFAELEALKASGFSYEVVVRMPGDILRLWGAKPEGRIREVRVDMLELRAIPPGLEVHETDEFIVSEAGPASSPLLQWILLGAAGLLAAGWIRRLRSDLGR